MAKLINENTNYINDVTKHSLDTNYSSYSRFLENAPIFVTYYKQNIVESTTDNGMGNVEVKANSKKYNKITNLPLYNVDKSSFDMDFEDNRIKAEYKSEGVLLPNTIEPIPEDFIAINYMDKTFVFMVTSFAVDNIKSSQYFKIEFKYKTSNTEYLDKVVVANYNCIFDRIGTEDNCLIESDNYNYLESICSVYDDIFDKYMDRFYVPKLDNFIFNGLDYKLYDPYLVKFISDNRLFEREYSSRSYHIMEVTQPLKGFDRKYHDSIYHTLEMRKNINNYNSYYRVLRLVDISQYFGNGRWDYKQIEIYGKDDNLSLYSNKYIDFKSIKEILNVNNESVNEFSEDNIVDTYKLDSEADIITLTDMTINKFIQLISLYLSNSDISICNKYITENLYDIIIDDEFDYFIYTPMILYVMKQIINNIKISK